jgi:hypothetical protein
MLFRGTPAFQILVPKQGRKSSMRADPVREDALGAPALSQGSFRAVERDETKFFDPRNRVETEHR